MTPGHLTLIVTQLVKAANIGKKGSRLLFRHAMATLMLEGGADVRMVQAMLGHASLNTTALYTHVAIRMLKEVHERTHPGAILGKPKAMKRRGGPTAIDAVELLAALEAENTEDVERTGAASAFDDEPREE
jgi:integrase/recombinase XerD